MAKKTKNAKIPKTVKVENGFGPSQYEFRKCECENCNSHCLYDDDNSVSADADFDNYNGTDTNADVYAEDDAEVDAEGDVINADIDFTSNDWSPTVGTVVVLNSGGPEMTVAEVLDNGRIVCMYFSGSDLFSEVLNTNIVSLSGDYLDWDDLDQE